MEKHQSLSLMEIIKIQSQVIIPLLNELRRQQGDEKALEIIAGALKGMYEERYSRQACSLRGTPMEKWTELNSTLTEESGGQVEIEFIAKENDSLQFRAKKCAYADYFKEINEPGLGDIMCCRIDYHIAKAAGPGVELRRSKTIMKGDDHCDFHYIFSDGPTS